MLASSLESLALPVQSQLVAHVSDIVAFAIRGSTLAHGSVLLLLLTWPVIADLQKNRKLKNFLNLGLNKRFLDTTQG